MCYRGEVWRNTQKDRQDKIEICKEGKSQCNREKSYEIRRRREMDEKEKEWNKETKREEIRKIPSPLTPHMLEGRTRTSLPASLGGTADSASLGDAVLPSQNKHALQYCCIFPRIWSSSGNYFPAFPAVCWGHCRGFLGLSLAAELTFKKTSFLLEFTSQRLCPLLIAGSENSQI